MAKFSVGDTVSLSDQKSSRLRVAEVSTIGGVTKYRLQNSFQSGAQGTFYPASKVVAAGEGKKSDEQLAKETQAPSNPDAPKKRRIRDNWF